MFIGRAQGWHPCARVF